MKKSTALILVLVFMIIIGMGTAAILQSVISYSGMRITNIDRIKAQYLAEAGIQYAVWQCRNGDFTSPVTITNEEWPIVITKTLQGDGSYEITARVKYPGI